MVAKQALVPFVLAAISGASAFGQGLLESGAEVAVATEEVPQGLSDGDWTSLRAAYEASRHQVFAVDGGHRAQNPGQRWTTLFDGRGFTTTPDIGGWSWGLELARYGWGAEHHVVAQPRSVSAEGGRISYAWDERLGEWYVNDARGLEHGYTLGARPKDATGPLVIELSIRGGLAPEISADGRDVRFLDDEGGAVLTYAGLAVFDADGRTVRARWKPLAGGLTLHVLDRDARYPLTIDPIAQQAYLKASNPHQADHFGSAVSVSGDTIVVGAQHENSNATGVNGNQTNNLALDSGAAYVFVRSGGMWSQQAYLKASNTDSFDEFGTSVSISGDTLVVGAFREGSNAAGVNGDGSNNLAADSGAAYVFVRNGSTWTQEAYLKASNTGTTDYFGFSVSISGDTLVVGAYGEDSNATGVNGDESNDLAADSGAAYVFMRSGTTWSQQAYLKASNTGSADAFGYAVSAIGDTLAVGGFREDSNATGVNGDGSNNLAADSGAAYVFVRNGSAWTQEAYLKASNTGSADNFGEALTISGDTVVVGAQFEDSDATGVNGNQGNNLFNSGAAYVFARSGSNWGQEAYLKASNTGTSDYFGSALSLSGDTLVVGAYSEDSNATGVNGDGSNNLAGDSGAAYVFVRSDSNWTQEAYLKASNTGNTDLFGGSLSLSGDLLVVGAHGEESNATGVNGNQANNSMWTSGAAYVFDLLDASVVYCTAGTSALGCQALISSTGTASASASSGFTLYVNGVESQKDGLFFFGTNGRQANPWSNSTSFQCVVPPVVRASLLPGSGATLNCDGSLAQDLNAFWCASCPKPSKNPGAGALVQAQFWYRNPLSPGFVTTALSDAIEFPVAP